MTIITNPIHANSLVFNQKGILILGESSSGKSDLTLRLIHAGAMLICDDYSHLTYEDNHLIAHSVKNIAGKLEIRGVGIITLAYVERHPIHFAVELTQNYQRYPDESFFHYENYKVPKFMLNPFEISVIDKIKVISNNL